MRVGTLVGRTVGGLRVGMRVGTLVGRRVCGLRVGMRVGTLVGRTEGGLRVGGRGGVATSEGSMKVFGGIRIPTGRGGGAGRGGADFTTSSRLRLTKSKAYPRSKSPRPGAARMITATFPRAIPKASAPPGSRSPLTPRRPKRPGSLSPNRKARSIQAKERAGLCASKQLMRMGAPSPPSRSEEERCLFPRLVCDSLQPFGRRSAFLKTRGAAGFTSRVAVVGGGVAERSCEAFRDARRRHPAPRSRRLKNSTG